MAVVNYSVLDDSKADFDSAFAGQNNRAIAARLMREAVDEHLRQQRRGRAIDALLRVRRRARPISKQQVRRARSSVRP